jgi:hypothetical protein
MATAVQCTTCRAVPPGTPRQQGTCHVWVIQPHTSQVTGFGCHGTRYVNHTPVDTDNPPLPPFHCRVCRGLLTADTATRHRRNCS